MTNGVPRLYIINFEALDVNLAALAQYLYDSSDVIAFWNYLPLVYCVKSLLSATELAAKLGPFFGQRRFLVAELNPHNLNGVLPRDAWDWFYLPHHEKHRAPALPGGSPQPVFTQGLLEFFNPPTKP